MFWRGFLNRVARTINRLVEAKVEITVAQSKGIAGHLRPDALWVTEQYPFVLKKVATTAWVIVAGSFISTEIAVRIKERAF